MNKSFFSTKGAFFLISLFLPLNIAKGQDKKTEWLANNCLFPMLEYDLLEVQPYAAMLVLRPDDETFEGIYIPVNLGFRKSVLQWKMGESHLDLAFGAASYTQFEIARFDENSYRGGLLNTDFKASGFVFFRRGRHHVRFQLFHVSSHLGDDYILRNMDYSLNDKSVNYEQLDITYLFSFTKLDLYAGLGYVISPNAFRDRLMIQTGLQATLPFKPNADWTLGTDIKIYDENDFIPDIHAAIGITIRQHERAQINFSVDGYAGALPYSTLEMGQVWWLGLSTRVYL